MFHNQSRNDSAPTCGAIPQGKGREEEGKGMEGNATAIWSLVEGGQVALHLKSLTGRQDAMQGGQRWV